MIEETYQYALTITDQQEADDTFEILVGYALQAGKDRLEAEILVRQNLGYLAGYHSNETRARVERLFRCSHPIFGALLASGAPTPEQAFAWGQKIGEDLRRRKEES